MSLSNLLTAALMLAFTTASPMAAMRSVYSERSGISWKSCGLNSTDELNRTVPVLCGTLSVPLDYTDTGSTSTINLPLLKISASVNVTKKETILINFGGPGDSGVTDMTIFGARLQSVIGEDHDLVTWHPRGTEDNLLLSCYADVAAREAAQPSYLLGNASDVAEGEIWSASRIMTDSCKDIASQNASLIGTAFTARDMMQIVDALDEDGLLRYWGISYGTVLGFTAATMFPNRVERLLIDGVVNAAEYYNSYKLTDRQSVDDVLMGFCQGCIQTHCALAANGSSATDLFDSIFDLIDTAKSQPIVLSKPASTGGDVEITYSELKAVIVTFMYSPSSWHSLADFLHGILTNNVTVTTPLLSAVFPSTPENSDAIFGIACGDKHLRTPSLDELKPTLQSMRTPRLGGDFDDSFVSICAQWPFEAKERYTGGFTDVKTRKPLLVIGNTWDPATPLVSARNANLEFEGSVLVEQRGYGHASVNQASLCTQAAVRKYFNEGVLPSEGTVCKVDERLFALDGDAAAWAMVLKGLQDGQNGTKATSTDD